MTVGEGIRVREGRRARPASAAAREPAEHVVVRLRRSGRHLVWPAVAFLGICFGTGYWWGRLQPQWLNTALPIVAGVLAVMLSAVPLVFWLNRVTIITNRRLIVTHGFVRRSRAEFPLTPGAEAVLRRGPIQFFANSGDVIVRAGDGTMLLRDVPRARLVHRVIVDLLARA